MERLGRLFVGIGTLWVAIMILWALTAGVDQPYAWFKWANDGLGYAWMTPTYLALALFVVPVGMLVFVRDILGDPVAMWVKWATPGTFLAIYAFFLLAALPDLGRPLFFGIESIGLPGATAPVGGAGPGPGSTTAWLIRLGVAILLLGGVPAVLGMVFGMLTGSKGGTRRR